MNNRDLANAFVAGATSGHGSNMFIEGQAIYSYGHHFPIAYHRSDGTWFYNNSHYSSSTSKQQCAVWQGLPDDNVVCVDTADIKRVMDGGRMLGFKQYRRTKAAKAIIAVMSAGGLSPVVSDWDDIKYGDLHLCIKWSKWYDTVPSRARVKLMARILTETGDIVAEICARDGAIKRGSDKLNIAVALFK